MDRTEILTLKMNLLSGMITYLKETIYPFLDREYSSELIDELEIEWFDLDENEVKEIAKNNELWNIMCYTFGKIVDGRFYM